MQIKVYLTLDIDTSIISEDADEHKYARQCLKSWLDEAYLYGIDFDDIEIK